MVHFYLLICLTLSFTLVLFVSLIVVVVFSSFFHLICAPHLPLSLTHIDLSYATIFSTSSPSVGVFVCTMQRSCSYIVASIKYQEGMSRSCTVREGLRDPSPSKSSPIHT
jgi:hypothetical protein